MSFWASTDGTKQTSPNPVFIGYGVITLLDVVVGLQILNGQPGGNRNYGETVDDNVLGFSEVFYCMKHLSANQYDERQEFVIYMGLIRRLKKIFAQNDLRPKSVRRRWKQSGKTISST